MLLRRDLTLGFRRWCRGSLGRYASARHRREQRPTSACAPRRPLGLEIVGLRRAPQERRSLVHPLPRRRRPLTRIRAKGKPESSAFVSNPDKLRATALDGHGLARKVRLRAKATAGSALASVTVADGDVEWTSANLRLKLSATTRCKANCHRNPNG